MQQLLQTALQGGENCMKWPYIAYGMAWLATGAAICVAIALTQRISPLWFFLMPLCVSIKSSNKKEDDQDG
jgi:heme/copper-type cytochrome/quinol oxidase subunit 1